MAEQSRAATTAIDGITSAILVMRGQRVILDRELAAIYGVPTHRLNEAVKRNSARFPEDFMFRLTREEAELSRSQIAILKKGRGQNIKHLPHAFTEHGAIQAANILNSARAVAMGVYVVRAFVQLRGMLASNQDLARQLKELELLLTRRLDTHDHAITGILKTIREMTVPAGADGRGIGFTADIDRKS